MKYNEIPVPVLEFDRGTPHFAALHAGYVRGVRKWEADERPEPRSLGLLPSGPDPVGEWLVHRQPPASYIGRSWGESKRRPHLANAPSLSPYGSQVAMF